MNSCEIDIISKTAKEHFNIDAPLPYQRLVINSILCAGGYYGEEIKNEEVKDRIIILPTGAGKSLCFMLPVILMGGIVVVVFPLLSLMSDQQRRCEEAHIECYQLKGGMSKEEKEMLFNSLKKSKNAILITNMESLLVENNLERLKQIPITQLVFDEAHTLFEWGEDFRPSLTKGDYIIKELHPTIVDAFTATASSEGIEKIKKYLFQNREPVLINANPDRENIYYSVIPTLSKTKVVKELFCQERKNSYLINIERPAILFFRNRIDLQKMVAKLKKEFNDIPVYAYHAKLPKEKKKQIEKDFFLSNDAILCATNAYGMGVDKANIRTIIHMQPPPTIESYLQESGRAGRDKKLANALLLLSPNDIVANNSKQTTAISSSLIEFLTNKEHCRRNSLLKAMGQEEVLCNGCDVCDNKHYYEIPKVSYLAKKINRLLRFHSQQELKRIITQKQKSFFAQERYEELSHYNDVELDEFIESIKVIKNHKKTNAFFPY